MSILWLAASGLLITSALLIWAWPVLHPPGASQPQLDSYDQQFLTNGAQLIAGTTALLLFSLALFCWRRGRQQIVRGGLKLDAAAKQPSTLYLRSFFDDQVKVLRDGLRYRVWLTDPFLENIRFRRFEEVIADAVWPFGGLVGLARPGEKLPELGAVRVVAVGRDWQEAIECLMDESRHILMTVGLTSGLKWEFQQTQFQGRLAKLSLVIPPESARSIATTWNNLVCDLPPLNSCPQEVVVRSLAVRFRDTGAPVFISAEQRSVAGYQLALDACWLPLNELLAASNAE